jgi:PAS domain S-box-containing protein
MEEPEAVAEELSAVFDAIADGVVIYALDGRILRMNEAAGRLLGITMEGGDRPIEERFGDYRVEDAAGRPIGVEETPFGRARRGEVVRGFELLWVTPKGKRRWLSASAAPVRRDDGSLAGVVSTFADVTQVRELQDERDDLVRMISHDLRTPLSVVLTQAQLLGRAPDRDVVRRSASIRASAERIARMIDELVEAVRLESGQQLVELRRIELAPFAHDVRGRLEGAVDVTRVRIAVADPVPPARADPAALERVLVNLLTNALKYSPASRPVDLELAGRGDAVTVTVRDRGPGIPPDEQGRVFERFYRARAAVRKEGLGLGLYISRLLTERMGGTLALESAPGRGTAFTVTLPAAPEDASAQPGA